MFLTALCVFGALIFPVKSSHVLIANRYRIRNALSPASPIEHYTLLEQIGKGGFGKIFAAEDSLEKGRHVAIKLFVEEQWNNPFGNYELKILSGLFSRDASVFGRYVPRVYKVLVSSNDGGSRDVADASVVLSQAVEAEFPFQESEQSFAVGFVMELCDGDFRNVRMQTQALIDFAYKASAALNALSDLGLVHHDVSMYNFLRRGEDVLVTDFGLSMFTNSEEYQRENGKLEKKVVSKDGKAGLSGSPVIIPPEKFASTKFDSFGFGVTLTWISSFEWDVLKPRGPWFNHVNNEGFWSSQNCKWYFHKTESVLTRKMGYVYYPSELLEMFISKLVECDHANRFTIPEGRAAITALYVMLGIRIFTQSYNYAAPQLWCNL